MFRSRGQLGQQWLLSLLAFTVASALITGLAIFFAYRAQFLATVDSQQEAATRAAANVEAQRNDLLTTLKEAGLRGNLMSLTPGQQKEAINRLQTEQNACVTLVIVDRTGDEAARAARRSDVPSLPDAWAQHEALARTASGDEYDGPVELHAGLPYMLVAVPIHDSQLQIVGMLAAQVDLTNLLWQVTKKPQASTADIYVVDQNGNLVILSNLAVLERRPNVKELDSVQAAQDKQPDSIYKGLGGTDVIGGVSAIAGTNWKAVAELPTDEAFSRLRPLLSLAGFQALLSIALMIGAWFYVNRQVISPILEITRGVQLIGKGQLDHQLEIKAGGELADMADTLNSTTAQLHDLVGNLEQRVAERTADLEWRSFQLEAASRVAQQAAAIRDVGQLLEQATRLISDYFGFYHVGIFLLDERREYAVLRAASSESGQRMLAQGHKLRISRVGIVGKAAVSGEPCMALNAGADAVYFNPDLPLTRSQVALPLKVQERVIGVLDVQSTQERAFTEDDVAVLQILADQIALALENARLQEEGIRTMRELDTLYGQIARKGWRERLARQPAAYRYTSLGVEPIPPPPASGEFSPAHSPDAMQKEKERRLVAPIRLRGQTLGSIVLQQDPEQEPWSSEEIALLENVSGQVALALESARLLEETRRLAAREQLIGEITARIRESLDVDRVLQTAAREFGEILDLAEVNIRLSPEVPDDGQRGRNG